MGLSYRLWLPITIFKYFSNSVECVKHKSNNFDVFLALHLFIMSNMSDNYQNKQNDAILLFKVGHMLIQIINQSILLFKGLSKHNPNLKD